MYVIITNVMLVLNNLNIITANSNVVYSFFYLILAIMRCDYYILFTEVQNEDRGLLAKFTQ